MMPHMLRPVLPLLVLAPLLLAGCGAARVNQVAVPATAVTARALAGAAKATPLEGPLTAHTVLAYGHTAARLLDPKAAFTSLTGTRIGVDGQPGKGGEWTLSYVGTEAVPSKGKAANPYAPIFRRITIVVPASGKPKAELVEAEGMPFGMCYYDAPMPVIDSVHVVTRIRAMRPEEPATGGYRLVLTGMMSPAHFQELVWKVGRTTQSAMDRPTTLSATTGEPIDK